MSQKPQLSFLQILNMSVGFLGIQFGFALQNANTSRIFQTLGADIENIPILWIAAPVTGLIVQPIIGHYSDRTWGRFGRRRPYFLAGALLASLALIIMPHSPMLWIAAGMLWMMDASINISMEPFRAFVGDMLPDEQRTLGFSMQSFFIGIGAVVASFLPYMLTNWFGVLNTAPEGEIPDSIKWSYYLGAIAFISAVAWTVFSTKEYPPEKLAEFSEGSLNEEATDEAGLLANPPRKKAILGSLALLLGLVINVSLFVDEVAQKEVFILGFGLIGFGLIELFAAFLQSRNINNGLVNITTDLNLMPKAMRQLALVQFFSWFALFAMWIYTTPAVTQNVFGSSDVTSQLYNDGADWVGIAFAIYNGLAAAFAFFLIYLARKTNRKFTHIFALLVGGISFISIFFIHDKWLLLVPFVGIGLTWASILAMPYAILTGSLPSNKMGTYMGIFNFFIVIPQILAASILGFIVKTFFNEQAIYALVIGGVAFIIAALLVIPVKDTNSK
jgi:maltose/moltooligosaccharide transporter